jgi:kynurenine formamidase
MPRSIADQLAASLGDPIDISITLRFDGTQPNAFGVESASSKAWEYGDLIGDTRRGGSCNFEQITLIPHCNGTHTECVGHITNERISIRECLTDFFVEADLVTIDPILAAGCDESYAVETAAMDRLITRRSLADRLKATGVEALIVRTLPNNDTKLTRVYKDEIPPYFTTEAMEFIVSSGIKHLLVDLPTIDRLYDEGKLSNHRIFWNVDPGSFETNANTRRNSTVTELIYVPDEVSDGAYVLNLQIAPFESDASPSRPFLFPIID